MRDNINLYSGDQLHLQVFYKRETLFIHYVVECIQSPCNCRFYTPRVRTWATVGRVCWELSALLPTNKGKKVDSCNTPHYLKNGSVKSLYGWIARLTFLRGHLHKTLCNLLCVKYHHLFKLGPVYMN